MLKRKREKAQKPQPFWYSGTLKSILMQFKARSWGRPSSHLISAERWRRAFQGFCYKDTTLPLLIYSWATWHLIRIFHKLLFRENCGKSKAIGMLIDQNYIPPCPWTNLTFLPAHFHRRVAPLHPSPTQHSCASYITPVPILEWSHGNSEQQAARWWRWSLF